MHQDASKIIRAVFASRPAVTFSQGTDIAHYDDSPEYIYQVKTGLIKEFMMSEQGIELTLGFSGESEIIPLVLDNTPGNRQSCYQAHTEAELYKVPATEFYEFVSANGEVYKFLSSQMNRKYATVTRP